MMRYVCVHGHFYQPPRENPWLEAIELQDSAYPYHDWNERITAECYAPNAASRILDGDGRIVQIVNNYARISFDVGPTLLAWLEAKKPAVYRLIVEADRESRERFSGHGSAMAQAYNHMIMPLASERDRYTQVLWGIRDFEHRFRRFPEGMWLPETAVDLATLDVMAALGIRFTVLAPHQARRVRKIGTRQWYDVVGGAIDPTMPYRVELPSGRTMTLFFYDGPISRAVAFEGLLSNGEHFAHRLMDGFAPSPQRPQLVHIATDGETYGHHHRHGDMALAYALHYLETHKGVRLTNYGEFLENHPPTHEVEIVEFTSWSCAHGVERWRSDCGCRAGVEPGWHQGWRTPLRRSLDWLRDAIAPLYEERGRQYLVDPWAARNDYIDVILERSPERIGAFLRAHARGEPGEAERVTIMKLLEMQRHLMLMYTSCGWFFDEVSGLETVQILQYAGRAIQLAEELFGVPLEAPFLERLAAAPSNLIAHGNGARVYERYVKPAMVDLRKVAAHYAVSSAFEPYGESTRIECYRIDRRDFRMRQSGRMRLLLGRARVTSEVTLEGETMGFAVVHFGDHHVNGGVRACPSREAYEEAAAHIGEAFETGDFPALIRLLDRRFGPPTYSIRSLFRDEQRRIMERVLASTLRDVEAVYRDVYDRHATLMNFLRELRAPLPPALLAAAEYVLNADMMRELRRTPPDLERVTELLAEARRRDVPLDGEGLAYALGQGLEALMEAVQADPLNGELLARLDEAAGLIEAVPFEVDLWWVQNCFYAMVENVYPAMLERVTAGEEEARRWVGRFLSLGDKLKVRVE